MTAVNLHLNVLERIHETIKGEIPMATPTNLMHTDLPKFRRIFETFSKVNCRFHVLLTPQNVYKSRNLYNIENGV